MLYGVGASKGIAIAKAYIIDTDGIKIEKVYVEEVENEYERFLKAIKSVKEENEELVKSTKLNIGEYESKIFEAHALMIEDPQLIGGVKSTIFDQKVSAEYATLTVCDDIICSIQSIEDTYLKERAEDVKDIKKRILLKLLNKENIDLSNLKQDSIIVSNNITPSDTANMDFKKVFGFISEVGGLTSHSVILARAMNIPAIVGIFEATKNIKNNDTIIVDGENGIVIVNPSQAQIKEYTKMKQVQIQEQFALKEYKNKQTKTTDGQLKKLYANIASIEDIQSVNDCTAEGIGLFRTEFLYLESGKLPTEQEQFFVYKSVLEKLNGKEVIFRTLDIGGDKAFPSLNLPYEENPFLGVRAIRLCLKNVELFKTQLRALLRASAFGEAMIMLPMISSHKELRDAKNIIEEVKDELRSHDIPFKENIKVGIMVEVPAVAIMADTFAKECDFFSIGTNDLIQYTVAVDRGNFALSHLYSQYTPAVLRLINNTIKAAHENNISCGMCGEVAADDTLIPILLGMGLDEFSVNPASLLRVRKQINETSFEEMQKIAEYVLSLSSTEEVSQYILELTKKWSV